MNESTLDAKIPEGCMQPARTVLERALAELQRALAMTGGSVDLRFYHKEQYVYEQVYVTIAPPREPNWMTNRGYFISATSFDTFKLAKIALTIVPDRVVEKPSVAKPEPEPAAHVSQCDTCDGGGEVVATVNTRGHGVAMCKRCYEEWQTTEITATEMVQRHRESSRKEPAVETPSVADPEPEPVAHVGPELTMTSYWEPELCGAKPGGIFAYMNKVEPTCGYQKGHKGEHQANDGAFSVRWNSGPEPHTRWLMGRDPAEPESCGDKHTIGTKEHTCRFPKGHEGAHQDTIGSTGVASWLSNGSAAELELKSVEPAEPTTERSVCDACEAPAVYECECQRCSGEPEESERYHACEQHRDMVDVGHIRVRGRGARWVPYKQKGPELHKDEPVEPGLCGAILGYANGANTTCHLPKGHDGAHHTQAWTRAWFTERESVRALGERIGYGMLMQLATETWRDKEPGSEFGLHCCTTFLVLCPGCAEAKARGEYCQWCCGSGQVTKRVADVIRWSQGNPRKASHE
jgi:hypothetical protein